MKKNELISRLDAITAMHQLQIEDRKLYGAAIPEEFDAVRAIKALEEIPEHCCYNCDCLQDQHYCLLHGLAVDLGMGCGDWEPEKDEDNERH